MESIAELLDKLSIVNTKLYNLLDRSITVIEKIKITGIETKDSQEMFSLLQDNVALVKQRSQLKKEIDARIDDAIKTGKNDVLTEVKRYG